jgi:hypothetical protein
VRKLLTKLSQRTRCSCGFLVSVNAVAQKTISRTSPIISMMTILDGVEFLLESRGPGRMHPLLDMTVPTTVTWSWTCRISRNGLITCKEQEGKTVNHHK